MYVAEFRYALRRLARAPAFTAAAALTLALGVSGISVLFTLLDAALLRPFPYAEGDRLVAIAHNISPGRSEVGLSSGSFTHHAATGVFESVAQWHDTPINLGGPGDPERRMLALVTASFFEVLRVRPLHGRLFRTADDEPGGEPSIVLGYELWQTRFGGDPSIVGQTVIINDRARPVVGVLPPGLSYPRPDVQLWMNAGVDPADRIFHGVLRNTIARLQPGSSAARAQAHLQAQLPSLAAALPDLSESEIREADLQVIVRPLAAHVARDAATALRIAMAAALLVLAIAVANVAALVVTRDERLRREIAILSSLGASRAHLARRFAADALLLALAGTTVGLLAAAWALAPIAGWAAAGVPRIDQATLGGRTLLLGMGTGLVIAAALLASSLPRFIRTEDMGSGVLRTNADGARARRARELLVGLQLALCLALFGAAALLGLSAQRLRTTDPGFDAEGVTVFDVRLPFSRYGPGRAEAFHASLRERILAIPGIDAVGATSALPLTPEAALLEYRIQMASGAPVDPGPVRFALVTPGLFEALGIGVHGWSPSSLDRVDARRQVLVSEPLAARLGGEQSIGMRIRRVSDGRTGEWLTVAGIVDPVLDQSFAADPAEIVYVPVLDATADPGFGPDLISFVVRSGRTPSDLVPVLRSALRDIDAAVPLANSRSMQSVVSAATARTRLALQLVTLAAAVAILLGLVGVWGVVAWNVSVRRREFGVRLALGARPVDLNAMVLRGLLRLAAVALACGLVPAMAASRALQSLLHGTSPLDAGVWVACGLTLVLAIMGAAWFPARRAGGTDPARAVALD
jgi:putative ABC transport system permease protein